MTGGRPRKPARSELETLIIRKYKKMQERATTKAMRKVGIAGVLDFNLSDLIVFLKGKSDCCKMEAWQCLYCKVWVVIQDLELDHFVPLARGGANTLDNLACSCHKCNQRKGALTGEEYARVLEFARLNLSPAAEQYLLTTLQGAGQTQRLRFERKEKGKA